MIECAETLIQPRAIEICHAQGYTQDWLPRSSGEPSARPGRRAVFEQHIGIIVRHNQNGLKFGLRHPAADLFLVITMSW